MKLFLSIVFGFLPFVLKAQNPINIGTTHKIHSHILNEEREYWIYLPSNYQDTSFTSTKYPVIYITDGDRNFLSTVAAQNDLSRGLYQHMPECIVVAVLNTERSRDLTPSKSSVVYNGKKLHSNSGGAPKFFEFLNDELKAEITKTYRTSGYDILMGHSFGGLFTLYTLVEHPQAFNAYIAHDPSIWWDNEYILKVAQQKIHSASLKNRYLYLSMAYNEEKGKLNQNHPDAIKKFCQLLSDTTIHLLNKWEYFESEDHGTIVTPATYQAFKNIFRGYCLPVKEIPEHPELVEKTYAQISKKLGFNFYPSPQLIKELAQYCESRQQHESAEHLLQLYVKTK